MSKGTVFLMYHELQSPGRELCDSDPGYAIYAVSEEDFRSQLDTLKQEGWSGLSVTEVLRSANDSRGVCITFDDGCATDLLIAAPLLRERGFNGTSYVTVNHLGRRGYLTREQLRELSDLGFEVGSHSMTHRHLNDLPVADLRKEIVDSKQRLEDITGRRVAHFSCPGGRVSSHSKEVAREAGYESVATSRIGLNNSGTDRFALCRIAIKRGMGAARVEKLCRGEGLFFSQAQEAVLLAAKQVLGNSTYEKIRSAILSS
jgi:peptidoglycan/xylan/chitin deacetylase (PgdA/CDA1 family)